MLKGKVVDMVGIPSGLNGKPTDQLNGKPGQIGTPSGLKEQYLTGKQSHASGISDRPASSAMDDNSGNEFSDTGIRSARTQHVSVVVC